MTTRHIAWACVFFVLGLNGCDNRSAELEKQNAELQQKTMRLEADLASRDSYVDEVTQSINTVYEDLERTRAKERLIQRESADMEASKKFTREEIRETLLAKVSVLDSTLKQNRQLINSLQKKVARYRSQYASLTTMVENLKKTLEEREESIALLELKVKGLEQQVEEKNRLITERDERIGEQRSLIDEQNRKITTGFYIIGTREELEQKGIIREEGGFLWGLFGSTTVLASGFDDQEFIPVSKLDRTAITVNGSIDQILPKRNQQFYAITRNEGKNSILTIAEPNKFWQDKYLVIIRD